MKDVAFVTHFDEGRQDVLKVVSLSVELCENIKGLQEIDVVLTNFEECLIFRCETTVKNSIAFNKFVVEMNDVYEINLNVLFFFFHF